MSIYFKIYILNIFKKEEMIKICEKNCTRKIVVVCLIYIHLYIIYNINILYINIVKQIIKLKTILPQTDKEKYREISRNDT